MQLERVERDLVLPKEFAAKELEKLDVDNYLLLKSQETIDERVDQLAARILDHYGSDPFVFVPILDGAMIFGSDLIKRINVHLIERGIKPRIRVETIAYSSYKGTRRIKRPEKIKETARKIGHTDRVLLVEDLIDSGDTIRLAQGEFRKRRPVDLKTAVLLSKASEAMGVQIRRREVVVDFKAFEEEFAGWLAFYTFDVDGKLRGRPGIGVKLDTINLHWYNSLAEPQFKIPNERIWQKTLQEKFLAQMAA